MGYSNIENFPPLPLYTLNLDSPKELQPLSDLLVAFTET